MIEKQNYSPEEVAEYLGQKVETIIGMLKNGRIEGEINIMDNGKKTWIITKKALKEASKNLWS